MYRIVNPIITAVSLIMLIALAGIVYLYTQEHAVLVDAICNLNDSSELTKETCYFDALSEDVRLRETP